MFTFLARPDGAGLSSQLLGRLSRQADHNASFLSGKQGDFKIRPGNLVRPYLKMYKELGAMAQW